MNRTNWEKWALALALVIISPLKPAHALSQVANPLFGATHLLPSPFTLSSGKFVFGSTAAVGVTDFMEIQTDVIADLYQIYNARVKLGLLDFPGLAAGLYVGFQSVNWNNISPSNPSITVNSWMPGGVIGIEVLPWVAVSFGGNLYYSSNDSSNAGIVTAGFLKGAQVESDISWAYHPKDDKMGNVVAGGVSYNSTYDILGFGVSHHWRGLQLGFHYYPNAGSLKVLPILQGGATFEL